MMQPLFYILHIDDKKMSDVNVLVNFGANVIVVRKLATNFTFEELTEKVTKKINKFLEAEQQYTVSFYDPDFGCEITVCDNEDIAAVHKLSITQFTASVKTTTSHIPSTTQIAAYQGSFGHAQLYIVCMFYLPFCYHRVLYE